MKLYAFCVYDKYKYWNGFTAFLSDWPLNILKLVRGVFLKFEAATVSFTLLRASIEDVSLEARRISNREVHKVQTYFKILFPTLLSKHFTIRFRQHFNLLCNECVFSFLFFRKSIFFFSPALCTC